MLRKECTPGFNVDSQNAAGKSAGTWPYNLDTPKYKGISSAIALGSRYFDDCISLPRLIRSGMATITDHQDQLNEWKL